MFFLKTMENNYYNSTFPVNFQCFGSNIRNIGMPDTLTILFEQIFSTNKMMKEKNKLLIITLHQLIQDKKIEEIRRFLCSDALFDLHPSLLKSSLIITENISELAEPRFKVKDLLNSKL